MKINDLDAKYFPEFQAVMAYCPKCEKTGGDDWSCCEGECPLSLSPHFNRETEALYLKQDC